MEKDIERIENKLTQFKNAKGNILDLTDNIILQRLILDYEDVEALKRIIERVKNIK